MRLPYLEGRLLQAREEIKRFQEKHRTTLDTLKLQGLPDDADYEMHEDFIEWEYWTDVLHKTEKTVKSVKTLLEETEVRIGVR